MSTLALEQIAEILNHASKHKIMCEPVRGHFEEDSLKKAYQVQAINIEKQVAKGFHVIGKKIGLTSFAVQQQLGVNEPDFGILLDRMLIPNKGSIPAEKLMQPKAEAEIAFVLCKDIDYPIKDIEQLADHISHALISLEVVGSRIKNWDITITDTVADNASASHFVLGEEKISLSDIDLENCVMKLYKNGELASEGLGKSSMGNPLTATQWLANKMLEMGTPLKKGEVILSGALGPMIPIQKGDSISTKIADFNEVCFRIE